MDNKLKFIIQAPGYHPCSGGIRVLHKLAKVLASLDEETYLVSPYIDPKQKPNFIWLRDLILDDEDKEGTVGIYPEIIRDNPLNTQYVVRWLLNTPGCYGGDAHKYTFNDMVYLLNKGYNTGIAYRPDGTKPTVDGILNLFYIDFDIFKDLGIERQPESQCYVTRKYKVTDPPLHNSSAIKIDDLVHQGDNKKIAEIFNSCETFISYDKSTFLYILAALCGCQSIVIPFSNLKAKEWRKLQFIEPYGVAYGFNEDEINYAKSTKHLLVNSLKEKEKESMDTVKIFIKNVYGKCNRINE